MNISSGNNVSLGKSIYTGVKNVSKIAAAGAAGMAAEGIAGTAIYIADIPVKLVKDFIDHGPEAVILAPLMLLDEFWRIPCMAGINVVHGAISAVEGLLEEGSFKAAMGAVVSDLIDIHDFASDPENVT